MLGSKETHFPSLEFIFPGLKIRVGLSVPVSFEIQRALGLEKPQQSFLGGWMDGQTGRPMNRRSDRQTG